MSIDLQTARNAALELNRLQQAASMLPQLEANEAKAASENNLKNLRAKILSDNEVLYNDFQQAVSNYRNEMETVVNSLKHLAASLKNVFVLRKRLTDNAQAYVSAYYEHCVKHLKMDVMQASFNAQNHTDDTMPGSVQFEPSRPGDPITGSVATILQHL